MSRLKAAVRGLDLFLERLSLWDFTYTPPRLRQIPVRTELIDKAIERMDADALLTAATKDAIALMDEIRADAVLFRPHFLSAATAAEKAIARFRTSYPGFTALIDRAKGGAL